MFFKLLSPVGIFLKIENKYITTVFVLYQFIKVLLYTIFVDKVDNYILVSYCASSECFQYVCLRFSKLSTASVWIYYYRMFALAFNVQNKHDGLMFNYIGNYFKILNYLLSSKRISIIILLLLFFDILFQYIHNSLSKK